MAGDRQQLVPKKNAVFKQDPQMNYKSCDSRETEIVREDDVPDGVKSIPPAGARFSREQKKLLAGLAVANILNGSLIAVMIPFFPVEAASRGVSQTTISALFSCFAVGQMIVSPAVGRLAPVFGITRLYNIGIGVAGLSTVAFGALQHIEDTQLFVAFCFVVRLVEAVGVAAVTTCGFTIAGSQFPGRVNTAVAWLGSALTVGLAMTPAVWGGLYALGGFGAPFYTLGALMLMMAAINARLMPSVQGSASHQTSFLKTLWLFMGSADNWICLATVFMFSADFNTVDSCIAPYADAVLGITPATIGLYFFVSTSMYAITNFMWGQLAERSQTPYLIMSPCLLMSALGILLLAPSPLLDLKPSNWLLGVGMSLEEVFFGGAFTPCYKTMLDASIERGMDDSLTSRSFISSMLQMVYTLGIAVGPVSGGAAVDAYGFPVMTTCMAFITASVGVLVAIRGCVKAVSRAGKHGVNNDATSPLLPDSGVPVP